MQQFDLNFDAPSRRELRRAFRYRLLPTIDQATALDIQRRAAARLYNAALQERIQGYRFGKVIRPVSKIGRTTQSAQIKDIRADGNLGVSHTDIAHDVLARVDKAFQAYFRRLKAGQTPGFPKYKASASFPSFTYRRPGKSCRVLENGRLHVGDVGDLRVRWHRPLEGTVHTITFKPDGQYWDVIFSCTVVRHGLPPSEATVGLDVGLQYMATRDTGETIMNPRFRQQSERLIRVVSRQIQRRKKGSKRRQKAAMHLHQIHSHIARQRDAFQHKETRKLVNQFGTIIVENLSIQGLARGMLAGPVTDASWGGFFKQLTDKAEETQRRIIAVDPSGTSQTCPCGVPVPKDLKQRWHHCPTCGLSVPRDQASAMEIKRRGLAQ